MSKRRTINVVSNQKQLSRQLIRLEKRRKDQAAKAASALARAERWADPAWVAEHAKAMHKESLEQQAKHNADAAKMQSEHDEIVSALEAEASRISEIAKAA